MVVMEWESPAVKMCRREIEVEKNARTPRPVPSDLRVLGKDGLRSKVSSVLSLMLAGGLRTRSFSYWLSGTTKKKVKRSLRHVRRQSIEDSLSCLSAHTTCCPTGVSFCFSNYITAPVHDERWGRLPPGKKKVEH